MDTKSLARSKRAHSQHHSKKSHPNPKSKPQQTASPSDSNAKNPPAKVAEKPRKPQGSSSSGLPSNWDRYEDEFDTSSEAAPATDLASEIVLPKSKGADFAFLISEAQSQLQSQGSDYSSMVPSFDDVLPDFNQGICSMLSVRGNGMLSWIGSGDNFIVDDTSTTSDEVSFFTMDLQTLASKLEKIDASQRLFVEPDILPPQVDVDRSKETFKPETEQAENCASGATEQCLEEFSSLGHCNDKSIYSSSLVTPSTAPGSCSSSPDQLREPTSSTTTTTGSLSVESLSCKGTSAVEDDSIKIERSSLGHVADSIAELNVNDAEDAEEKSSAFEASAAEAELDLLLNSFAEVKLPDSSGMSNKFGNNLRVSEWSISNKLSEGHLSRQPSEQGSKSSKNVVVNVEIDDTIDDLLRETSVLKDQNKSVIQLNVVPPLASSNSNALLDDFDSWLDTI